MIASRVVTIAKPNAVELGGKYAVVRLLGRGAMGTVYEATHRALKRRVAVKVLHDQHIGDTALLQRFAREAVAVSQLRSRHIVRVFDSDTTASGAPFIVMELLSGRDLAVTLRAGSQSTAQVVDWIVQICSAMDEAHRRGIIHRDLKPSNVFIVEPDLSVRVVDFGISRLVEGQHLTGGSEILGTPNYIAPEVLKGRPAEPRSDLYAIGVIAYRALSDRFPCQSHEESNPLSALLATVSTPATPLGDVRPDLPEALAAAVMRALAKDPQERFASARDMALAFEPFGTAAGKFEELPATDSNAPVKDATSFPPPSFDIAIEATQSPTTKVVAGSLAGAVEAGTGSRPRRFTLGLMVLAAVAAVGVIGAAVGLRSPSPARAMSGPALVTSVSAPVAASAPAFSLSVTAAPPPTPSSTGSAPAPRSTGSAPAPSARATAPRVPAASPPKKDPAPKPQPPHAAPAGSGEVLFL